MVFKQKVSTEEAKRLFEAAAELSDKGAADICCPFCKGALKLGRKGTSYAVYCENQCCGVEARGI